MNLVLKETIQLQGNEEETRNIKVKLSSFKPLWISNNIHRTQSHVRREDMDTLWKIRCNFITHYIVSFYNEATQVILKACTCPVCLYERHKKKIYLALNFKTFHFLHKKYELSTFYNEVLSYLYRYSSFLRKCSLY